MQGLFSMPIFLIKNILGMKNEYDKVKAIYS